MRHALASLPWVEERTIKADRDTHAVEFGINDRAALDKTGTALDAGHAEALKKALGDRYRKDMSVTEVHEVEKKDNS